MSAESSLVRDIICYVLCMFPCDDRMIKQVIIKILSRIFKVKLHKLNTITKSIEGHLDSFSYRNKLFGSWVEYRQCLYLLVEWLILGKLVHRDPCHFFIEQLGDVEHCKSILLRHIIKKVRVLWLPH